MRTADAAAGQRDNFALVAWTTGKVLTSPFCLACLQFPFPPGNKDKMVPLLRTSSQGLRPTLASFKLSGKRASASFIVTSFLVQTTIILFLFIFNQMNHTQPHVLNVIILIFIFIYQFCALGNVLFSSFLNKTKFFKVTNACYLRSWLLVQRFDIIQQFRARLARSAHSNVMCKKFNL